VDVAVKLLVLDIASVTGLIFKTINASRLITKSEETTRTILRRTNVANRRNSGGNSREGSSGEGSNAGDSRSHF